VSALSSFPAIDATWINSKERTCEHPRHSRVKVASIVSEWSKFSFLRLLCVLIAEDSIDLKVASVKECPVINSVETYRGSVIFFFGCPRFRGNDYNLQPACILYRLVILFCCFCAVALFNLTQGRARKNFWTLGGPRALRDQLERQGFLKARRIRVLIRSAENVRWLMVCATVSKVFPGSPCQVLKF
jgi:hypothetical protein